MSRDEIFIHNDTLKDKLCNPKSEKPSFGLHGLQLSVKLRKPKRTTSGATRLIFYFNREQMIVIFFNSTPEVYF